MNYGPLTGKRDREEDEALEQEKKSRVDTVTAISPTCSLSSPLSFPPLSLSASSPLPPDSVPPNLPSSFLSSFSLSSPPAFTPSANEEEEKQPALPETDFASADLTWLPAKALKGILNKLRLLNPGALDMDEMRLQLADHLTANSMRSPQHWTITVPACRVRDITMLRQQSTHAQLLLVYPEYTALCEQLNETGNQAERTTIEKLRRVVRPRCMAIYSFRWLSSRDHINRENDFLVLDSYGIFVLEVKGYRDGCNGATVANGVEHGRSQGSRAVTEWLREGLWRFIQQDDMRRMWWKGGKGMLNFGTAVLLPDFSRSDDVASRVGSAQDIAWKNECESSEALAAFLDSFIARCAKDQNHPRLTVAQYNVIDDWLSTKMYGNFTYEVIAQSVKQVMEVRWTQGQHLVSTYYHHRFACVQGFAGTGKTLMAIHRVFRLAEHHSSAIIVIIVRMEHLKSFLQTAHPQIETNPNIHVITMNSDSHTKWPETAVDHLIVDEMQRVLQDAAVTQTLLSKIAELRARDGTSCWLYYDDNQKHPCFVGRTVEGELKKNNLWEIFFHLYLNEPVRLTANIFKAARVLYTGEFETITPTETGRLVDWITLSEGLLITRTTSPKLTPLGKMALGNHLRACLDTLVDGSTWHGMESRTAIITLDKFIRDEVTQLLHELRGKNDKFVIAQANEAWSDCMVVDAVSNFQGIDREHIIFLTLGFSQNLLHRCYIAMTRAISTLMVVGQKDVLKALGMP